MMASRSSVRIKSQKRERRPPPSSNPSNPLVPPKHATKLRATKTTPCFEGLDFVGHCPICLEKLQKTELAEGGRGDVPVGSVGTTLEKCADPIYTPSPTVIPFSKFGSVWQYLHGNTESPLEKSTLKFTFKAQAHLERSRNSRVKRASTELSEFPTMCGTCHVEVLKLYKLHEELEAIERALKSQVETIRNIVSCNISQRREFEKVLISSCNGERKGTRKVIQFLEFIGNEVISVTPLSEASGRPRRKLLLTETEGDKNRIRSQPVGTLQNDLDDKNLNSREEGEQVDLNDSIPLTEGNEQYQVLSPVADDPDVSMSDQSNDNDNISDDDWEEKTSKKTNIGRKMRKKTSNVKEDDAAGASSTERQYGCTECDKVFRAVSALREHFFKFHTKGLEKGPAELLKCDKCGKVFKYKPSLQFHKNFEDCTPNDKVTLSWTCPLSSCDKTFSTRKELRLHKLAAHQGEKRPDLRCEVCKKELKTVGHLKRHMKTHDKGRPVCEICGLDFAKTKFLLKHKSVHSGELPFCCELCGKQFRLAGFLREHKKNAHRELFGASKKDVTCDHCGKTFHTSKNLKEHMMLHTGAKPFVCEVCGKKFRIRRNLKSHMNYLHSKDKQTVKASKKTAIACQVCGKQYGNKRSLAGHVKLQHTDFTPFSCDECQLGFKSKYLLRDHQNMVHITSAIASLKSAEVSQSVECLAPGPVVIVEVSSSEENMGIDGTVTIS